MTPTAGRQEHSIVGVPTGGRSWRDRRGHPSHRSHQKFTSRQKVGRPKRQSQPLTEQPLLRTGPSRLGSEGRRERGADTAPMLVGCGLQPGDTTGGAAVFGPWSFCTRPTHCHDQDCLLALVGLGVAGCRSSASRLSLRPFSALFPLGPSLPSAPPSLFPYMLVLQTQGDMSLPPSWS